MEIKNFNLKELSLTEVREVNGGDISFPKLPKWVKGSLLGFAIGVVIDNWADIKSGIVDGWTDAKNEG